MFKKCCLYTITLLLALCSCTTHKGADDRPTIMVTIEAQRYFVERIVGDKMEVNSVIPSGCNSMLYTPQPGLLVEISKCDGYLSTGHLDFELAWLDKLQHNSPELRVYDTSEGVELICSSSLIPSSLPYSGIDPHFWCAPRETKVMVKNIYHALIQIDPENEEHFSENYRVLMRELEDTDNCIRQQLAPVAGESFVIFHPSLTYIARDYNLTQLNIECEGRECSLQEMVRVVKQHELPSKKIIVQEGLSNKSLEKVAQECNYELVTIDLLAYNYFTELDHIIDKLLEVVE